MNQGFLVTLVKPQFEVGREVVSSGGGIVKDEAIRIQAIDQVIQQIESKTHFKALFRRDATVEGVHGNRECLVLWRLDPVTASLTTS